MGRLIKDYLPKKVDKIQISFKMDAPLKVRMSKYCVKKDIQQKQFLQIAVKAFLDAVGARK